MAKRRAAVTAEHPSAKKIKQDSEQTAEPLRRSSRFKCQETNKSTLVSTSKEVSKEKELKEDAKLKHATKVNKNTRKKNQMTNVEEEKLEEKKLEEKLEAETLNNNNCESNIELKEERIVSEPVESSPEKKIGAHVSGAGGLHNAVANAIKIGANSFALFLRNQRQWNSKRLEDEDADLFKKAYRDANISPELILPHGIYLVNCASPDEELLAKSRMTLVDELKRCEKLGLKFYNFHPGSTCGKISVDEGIERIAKSINDAHQETENVVTLLENMCCQGDTVSIWFKKHPSS